MNSGSDPCTPLVDAHVHIFRADDPLTEEAWARPQYDYTAEHLLADLDANGIVFGVIAAASLYGSYNDYVLSALAAHPRLRGTVRLGPEDCDDRTLRRLHDGGVVGVRFQWPRSEPLPDVSQHDWRVFFKRIADAGMHAELNVGGGRLAQVLDQLAGIPLPLVIDHLGLLRDPDGIGGAGYRTLRKAADSARAIVKLSGLFRFKEDQLEAIVPHLLADVGPERLVWGSDAPFVGHEGGPTYGAMVERYRELVPSPTARQQICKTALRFYFT